MANLIGQTLLNQFRVDAFVASGGMGAVYRVWDLKRNAPLAMKVMHSELAEDPAMFKRFEREANALKRLAHPNIVPFYGLYQTSEFDFLLERYIDGPSLKDILKQRQGKPLQINEALIYLNALCAALGYAHASGVVHCDVKPGNVMVDRGGSVYLTDFGIVRHSESTSTTMGTAGTPAYMAPEQIRGEVVSAATDIYALGVVLYEMLTGRCPFRGTDPSTERGGATANERIRYGHLNLQPADPRIINPAISAGLANAILKAMAKRPQDRYASTLDFFNTVCRQAGGTAGNVGDRVVLSVVFEKGQAIKAQASIPLNPGVPQSVQSSKSRSAWLVVGGVIGAVVICVLAIAVLVSLLPKNSPPPSLPLQTGPTDQPAAYQLATAAPTIAFAPVATNAPVVEQIPTLTFTPRPSQTPVNTDTATPDSSNPTPYPIMSYRCPGARASQVAKGDLVKVTTTQGDKLLLRSSPEKLTNNANKLDSFPAGTELRVIGDYACSDNYMFWPVQVPGTNEQGWVIEGDFQLYYIEPIY